MEKPKKGVAKKDNTNKVAQTSKNREARKLRQELREAKAEAKVLRRAAEGKVIWDARPKENGTGLYVTFAKGGSQSLLRRMLKQGKLRQSGKKLVPVVNNN